MTSKAFPIDDARAESLSNNPRAAAFVYERRASALRDEYSVAKPTDLPGKRRAAAARIRQLEAEAAAARSRADAMDRESYAALERQREFRSREVAAAEHRARLLEVSSDKLLAFQAEYASSVGDEKRAQVIRRAIFQKQQEERHF